MPGTAQKQRLLARKPPVHFLNNECVSIPHTIKRVDKYYMGHSATYIWDETKAVANVTNHGVEFAAITGIDWTTALIANDTRFD